MTYRCASRETPSGPCGSRRVPAADLEQWAWEEIFTRLQNPTPFEEEFKRQQEVGPDPALLADKGALERSLTKLEQQQAKLVRTFREDEEGQFPPDLFRRELAQIDKEKEQLVAALTQVEARLAAWQVNIQRWDSLTVFCRGVAQKLETFDIPKKRLALELLAVTVRADGRNWELNGSIPEDEQIGIVSRMSWG